MQILVPELLRRHRRHCLIIASVFLGVSYIYFSLQNYSSYAGRRPFTNPAEACEYLGEEKRALLLNWTYRIHLFLHENRIDHWLCYGSVFGALRYEGLLPWDRDVDIALKADGRLAQLGVSAFINLAEKKGFRVVNHWYRSRLLQIYVGGAESNMHVDLMAFHESSGWMKRAGWETWLTFINFNRYHTFPTRLIQAPLPMSKFGPFLMPIPRQGIEIQKYLYPDDWWDEVKPAGCSDVQDA